MSKFNLPYKQLHLAFIIPKKFEKMIIQMGLIFIKAIKIFEYGNNNNKYWNKAYL